jgi:hypothetical protein
LALIKIEYDMGGDLFVQLKSEVTPFHVSDIDALETHIKLFITDDNPEYDCFIFLKYSSREQNNALDTYNNANKVFDDYKTLVYKITNSNSIELEEYFKLYEYKQIFKEAENSLKYLQHYRLIIYIVLIDKLLDNTESIPEDLSSVSFNKVLNRLKVLLEYAKKFLKKVLECGKIYKIFYDKISFETNIPIVKIQAYLKISKNLYETIIIIYKFYDDIYNIFKKTTKQSSTKKISKLLEFKINNWEDGLKLMIKEMKL